MQIFFSTSEERRTEVAAYRRKLPQQQFNKSTYKTKPRKKKRETKLKSIEKKKEIKSNKQIEAKRRKKT